MTNIINIPAIPTNSTIVGGSLSATIDKVTTPVIANVTASVADTEYSYALPSGTTKFLLRSRSNSKLQLTYTAGQTATTFITVYGFYEVSNLDSALSFTIYFEASQNGTVVEIVSWS